uniref:Uncharacterized protein n=1 Tax=Avena sativa TaxID=4498 RepID=A0ACD5X3M7_AVESA
MARGDKDDNPNWANTDEYKAWLGRMEAMDVEELMEYARVNKDVLSEEMKAIIKKLIQKKQPRRKKRALHPILGAVLKFHRDDDDTPPPGPGGANAC